MYFDMHRAHDTCLVSANERSTLLIQRYLVSAARDLDAQRDDSLANPEQGENGKRQRGPVNERAAILVREHRPQVPSNGNARRQVSFGRREGVGGCGGLEEEKGEEHEHLRPDTGMVSERVHAKCGKCGQNDEDGGPAVIEGEREVDKDLVSGAGRLMILLDDVVDVRDGRRDEEGEDESYGH